MVKSSKTLGLLALALSALVPSAGAVERRIIVFRPDTTPAQRIVAAQAAGAVVTRELRLIDAVAVEQSASGIQIMENRLRANVDVLRIDDNPRINWLEAAPQTIHDVALPDVRSFLKAHPIRRTQDSPAPADPVKQEVPWGITRVNAPASWAASRGAGVKVGIIDTGIDPKHPDLKDNVAGGWNAIAKNDNFADDHGHGTHVAGTVAAADNAEAVVGVAPSASVYGIKVLDANGSGTFDDVIAGMEWCVTNKMNIASMSLGASRGNDSLKAAVEKLNAAGVAVIAAAGNSGRAVGYPAAYPQAIAIAASDSGDKVAWFSSRGPEVDFIAPGVNVNSLAMGGGTASMSGTSMATPHMSGLAALAIAAKDLKDPEAVRAALKAASTPFKDVPVEQQGAGLPDAAKLVK